MAGLDPRVVEKLDSMKRNFLESAIDGFELRIHISKLEATKEQLVTRSYHVASREQAYKAARDNIKSNMDLFISEHKKGQVNPKTIVKYREYIVRYIDNEIEDFYEKYCQMNNKECDALEHISKKQKQLEMEKQLLEVEHRALELEKEQYEQETEELIAKRTALERETERVRNERNDLQKEVNILKEESAALRKEARTGVVHLEMEGLEVKDTEDQEGSDDEEDEVPPPQMSAELKRMVREMIQKETTPHVNVFPPLPRAGSVLIPIGGLAKCCCSEDCTQELPEPAYRIIEEAELKERWCLDKKPTAGAKKAKATRGKK